MGENFEVGDDILNGVLTSFHNNGTSDRYIAKVNNNLITDLRLFYPNSLNSWSTYVQNMNTINVDIKFRSYYLFIRSYSFKSSDNKMFAEYHPTLWNVFGALNDGKWNLVDEENISNNPFGPLEKRNFACKTGIFNRIRIEFKQPNQTINNFGVAMRRIDFFGYLMRPNVMIRYACTLKYRTRYSHSIFIYIFLIST